jgi:hypothetical protein
MRKLFNRTIVAQDRECAICQEQFDCYNDIVPDHRCPKGREEVGETTIRTISRLCTGGATQKRDRAEPKNDERSGAVTAYLNGGRWKLIATEVESGKKDDRPELIKALTLPDPQCHPDYRQTRPLGPQCRLHFQSHVRPALSLLPSTSHRQTYASAWGQSHLKHWRRC